MTEVGDGMAGSNDRTKFVQLLEFLNARPDVEIIRSSGDVFDLGFELYKERPDKEWSLTDCISMVVMKKQSVREALTGDHHFKQAGFDILF